MKPYDRVLQDLGYDPNYKIGYTASNVYNTRTPAVQKPTNNYVGNVFNSIKSAIGAVPGFVGGALKKTFFDEPAALGNIIGKKFTETRNAPKRAELAGRNFKLVTESAVKNFREGKLSQSDYLRILDNAKKQYEREYKGALTDATNPVRTMVGADMEYNKKAAPVALTALTLAAPAMKAGSFASVGERVLPSNPIVNKVATRVAGFGDELIAPGQTIGKNALVGLAGKVARNELVVQPTLNAFGEIPQDVKNIAAGKDVGASALNLGLLAAPYAAEGLAAGGKKLGGIIKNNLFSTSGLFDNVILKSGKTVNQELKAVTQELKSTNPKYIKSVENRLKVIQDLALQESGGNPKLAAQLIERYQPEVKKFKNQDLDQFLKNFTEVLTARKSVQKIPRELLTVNGKNIDELGDIGNITVARLTQENRKIIADRLSAAENKLAELKALQKEGLVKNKNLVGQIQDIIKSSGEDSKLIRSRINSITAGSDRVLVKGKPVELANGYFPVFSRGAGVVNDAKSVVELASGTSARFEKVGNLVRKLGISPEDVTAQDNRAVYNKVKQNLVQSVDGIGGEDGKTIVKKLNALVDKTVGVTDFRQLSASKIEQNLRVSREDARQIVKATKNAYKGLSYEERGLANKIIDANFRYNPIAAPYSRAQSVLRYEKNPFFRIQEGLETKFGLKSMGGKIAKPGGDYTDTIKTLENASIFKTGYGGEGQAEMFGGLKSGLMRSQENDIAATIEHFAGGKDKVAKWLKDPKNFDLLEDIKTVVQYPDKGFTSSNLAKMMNLVAFPSRYNIKVTQFAIKQLMKQPAPVQISILRGLADFNEFAKSPEGIKWQADNKEVIGLFKYFTPIQPIAQVYNTLTGNNETLGDAGLIGGLPFGFIYRVLQGQGIVKDSPYVDPRTGNVYPQKIPKDLKSRAKQMLSDIVGTMYTYPGRDIGAPSKSEMTNKLIDAFSASTLGTPQYDYVDRSGDVNKSQQRQIEILKSLNKKPTSLVFNQGTSVPATQSIKAPLSIVPAPIYKAKKTKAKNTKPKNFARPISTLFK